MRLKKVKELIDFTDEEKEWIIYLLDRRIEELKKVGYLSYKQFKESMKERIINDIPLANIMISDLNDMMWIYEYHEKIKSIYNKTIMKKLENTEYMKDQARAYYQSEKRNREIKEKNKGRKKLCVMLV